MSEPLLELRNFTCERDSRPLFVPVSLTVAAGAIVQLEGPNGVGKTTLLRAICGLSTSYVGDLFWQGRPVRRDRLADESLFIGHATGLKGVLTARQNLRWWTGLRGLYAGSEIDDALAEVGLAGYEDVPCYQLSAGQQRRVALARLFLDRARLWILDEPFTAIDRHGVAQLEQWLVQHVVAGNAVLLTTHQSLRLPVPVAQVVLRAEDDDA